MNKKVKFSGLWTAILSVVSVAYIFPILLVLINSFKKKAYISRYPFAIPTDKMFVGLENYVNGLTKTGFFQAFGWTLFITVFSVAVILLCTSMCAWYINRVTNTLTKTMYMLCLFSMVVPFQMVMFTLVKVSNMFHLDNLIGIIFIYVGFGAGLSVFMFTGFIKSIPVSLEEAAMIDGCSIMQIYFKIVFPVIRPIIMTVAILNAMWIWNDYLLPYLVLDIKKYKTISIATVAGIEQTKTDAVQAVQNAQSTAPTAVTTKQTEAVQAVDDERDAALRSVQFFLPVDRVHVLALTRLRACSISERQRNSTSLSSLSQTS